MDITTKAKEELDKRIERIENYIEERGVGSSYLNRAKKVQRSVNFGLLVGGVLTAAGITIWAISKSKEED